MINKTYFFTSESVSEGHPDKIADQVSDAILDAFLTVDPYAKVACETLITNDQLIIAGEFSATARPAEQLTKIAKEVLRKIGYTHKSIGFDCDNAIYTDITHTQSREINASVAHGGAGDQGLMFGYACDETPQLMPMAITVAHLLIQRLTEFRHSNKIPWLLPDAKSQVTIRYEDELPVDIDTVVVSTQHMIGITQEEIERRITNEIILPVVHQFFSECKPKILVNTSGSFTIGGPHGDTGLTGRKIIVDTYGGSCPHGGGAFSGKDPSKVDRAAVYAARYVAKHIVAAGMAKRCTVQLSYAIGVEEPTSVHIDCHGTSTSDESTLTEKVKSIFDLRPKGIIKMLDLRKPIYLPTASGGHFGRPEFAWEKIDPDIITKLEHEINGKVDYNAMRNRYEKQFSKCTDEELILHHNNNEKIEFISQGPMTWLSALHAEILRRSFDSEIITKRLENGSVSGYNYNLPVVLKDFNGKKKLFLKQSENSENITDSK